MKKCLLFILPSLFLMQVTSAQVFWEDNFEGTSPNTGGGTRSASNHTNTTDGSDTSICGLSDYFFRTTDPGAPSHPQGLDEVFTNIEGSTYWRAEDLDGCIANPDVINFTGIDITGRGGLTFLGYFAARTTASMELTDEIRMAYQIDGTGYIDGLVFEPTALLRFQVDTNNDGVGDGGTNLNAVLTQYTFSIPSSGATLDLRLTVNVNGGGEELAFDLFQVSESALPVKLVNFEARAADKHILLKWQTATEINNEKFEIERSHDGKVFKKMGEIKGRGTAVEEQDYLLADEKPFSGINYYRLKQFDFDGKYEYSRLISVIFEVENGYVGDFYPNPSQGFVYLEYRSENVEKVDISIFDITGKLILRQAQLVSKGSNNLSLDFSNIRKGVYIVRVDDGLKHSYRKLIIE